MAAKSSIKKTAPEVNASEPRARVSEPKTPRVKAAKHAKATMSGSLQSEEQSEDSQAVIARIAYGFWEARSNEAGSALEDWLRAEQTYRQLAR
jgi:hypothetical protein